MWDKRHDTGRSGGARQRRYLGGTALAALTAGTALGTLVLVAPARAVDGTWTGATDDQWTDSTNWTSFPFVPDNVATFTNNGAPVAVTISSSAGINNIQFTALAPAYSYTISGALTTFSITGAGIVNNSAFAPSFTNNSSMQFFNFSGAGNATITNTGTGSLGFSNNATAGTAHIINSGSLQFVNSSTAGSATIDGNAGGAISFFNTSTTNTATFTIDSSTLSFRNNSTAGSATIGLVNSGTLFFREASRAVSASITADGAGVQFHDTSTAVTATISVVNGGSLDFFNTSTAATAGITVDNSTASFNNASTAGSATIGIVNGGSLSFFDTSTAGSANITIDNSSMSFFGNSTAGLARLITNAGATVDFSGSTGPLGDNKLSAGSIEGGGTYTLGANELTVGANGLSTVFSGSINGAGSLVKTGAGTLTLSGANAYLGLTTISAGTLRIGDGGTTGSIAGDVLNNSALVFNRSNALSYGGVISGTGTVQKAGAGTLTLSNTNTYNGTTTVSAGTLLVTGSIASSSVTVNSGAILGGTGTVGSTTINNGATLSPGPAIGTLAVAGNLTFNTGATYLVDVSTATADRTDATGTASLAGTVNATLQPGSYIPRSYVILHADGGRSGTFGALSTTGLPGGFAADLSYTATDAILTLTAALGALSGLNQNQQSVASAINNSFNSGNPLPPGFLPIFGITGPGLGNALSQLTGEAGAAFAQTGFQVTGSFLNLMLNPYSDGRNGNIGGFGPAIGYAPEASLPREAANAYASALSTFGQRWSTWGSAYGGQGTVNGDVTTGTHKTTSRIYGIAAGLDKRLSPATTVGFALTGGGTNWGLSDDLGGGRSGFLQVGTYASHRVGPAYLSAALAYAWHQSSTSRTVTAGGATDVLAADFTANNFGGRLEGGYRWLMPWAGVTPYAAVQAQMLSTPSYSERVTSGLGTFALNYNSQTTTTTRTELGAWFDQTTAYAGALLVLRLRAAWAHDFGTGRPIGAMFQTLPGSAFTVNGAAPASEGALLTASSEYHLRNGLSFLTKFDGEFSRTTNVYAGTGTLRYTW